MAKPSKWNQELVDAICEELADGKSQRIIFCTQKMPGRSGAALVCSEGNTPEPARARTRGARRCACRRDPGHRGKAVLGERLKKDGRD